MKDKEKFRAEIEKMFNEALNRAKVTGGDEYWTGKADAYRNTLTSLDSMQKESEYSVGNIIFKNDSGKSVLKTYYPDGRITSGYLKVNFADDKRREYDEIPIDNKNVMIVTTISGLDATYEHYKNKYPIGTHGHVVCSSIPSVKHLVESYLVELNNESKKEEL